MSFFVQFFKLGALLFLFRLFDAVFYWPMSSSEFDVFLTGLRFDLLIISFMLLPIVLIQLIFSFRHKLISQITQFYLSCGWLFVLGLCFINSLLFSTLKDRVWLQDWDRIFDHLTTALQSQSFLQLSLLLVLSVLLYFKGLDNLKSIRQIILNTRKRRINILILLLLAFFGRGSLGPDHLRRNDCDFKSSSWVRAICLNPVYTFTKLKNTEF